MTSEENSRHDVESVLGSDVPPPRRSDAAFARAVREGVQQRRSRALFALPALALGAAGAAALAFVITTSNVASSGRGDGRGDGATTIAAGSFADLGSALEDDGLFALPDLDGSSDEELARLDALLDAKIEEASRRKL